MQVRVRVRARKASAALNLTMPCRGTPRRRAAGVGGGAAYRRVQPFAQGALTPTP